MVGMVAIAAMLADVWAWAVLAVLAGIFIPLVEE